MPDSVAGLRCREISPKSWRTVWKGKSFQTAHSQAHNKRSAGVSLGSLDGALQNAELMAEREDLQLERRTAPEGSEKRSQERAQ
jgi:hypothetical protein